MTDPRVAALAVDLDLKLGTDLEPRRRKPASKGKALATGTPPTHHSPLTTPQTALVPDDTEDLIEFTPTSQDYRAAMRAAGWRAVYIAGPETAVPTVMASMQLWPFCVGTTATPRDIKRIAQLWSWHAVALHAVLWCETPVQAESLKTRLIDALDFRHHHLNFRFFSLEPGKAKALALEVARTARIPVFEEAQRLEWLDRAVRLTAEERQRWLSETVTEAIKRIGGRR